MPRPCGVDEEAALAAEHVLEPTPLRVQLDSDRGGQPATLRDRHGLLGRDPGGDDVTGQMVGDVDPAAGVWGGEGRDEQALAAEERALQALHHTALGAGLHVHAGRRRHHRAGLCANCSPGSSSTRATANDGLWRTSTFTPPTVGALSCASVGAMVAKPPLRHARRRASARYQLQPHRTTRPNDVLGRPSADAERHVVAPAEWRAGRSVACFDAADPVSASAIQGWLGAGGASFSSKTSSST